jgi:hypothetical protein
VFLTNAYIGLPELALVIGLGSLCLCRLAADWTALRLGAADRFGPLTVVDT